MTAPPTDGPAYQDRALATLCPEKQIDINRVHWVTLRRLLREAAGVAEDLDAVKKSVVYNKPFPARLTLSSLGSRAPALVDPQIIHAILGIITEAGELAQTLLMALFEGGELDVRNLCEGSGDIDWYQALLDSRVGYSQEQRWADNIAKLEKRCTRAYAEARTISEDALTWDTTTGVAEVVGVSPTKPGANITAEDLATMQAAVGYNRPSPARLDSMGGPPHHARYPAPESLDATGPVEDEDPLDAPEDTESELT